ncbi:MAG: globin domain-containing protein [Streptomycetales bacterium]
MLFDPRLLKESFALVEDVFDQVAGHFYALLFLERPELREMFPAAMDGQRDRFFRALISIVHGIDRADFLHSYLAELGRDHRKFAVRPEHYDSVGKALIGAMRRYVGESWTPEMEAAWIEVYQRLAGAMIDAAEQAEDDSPPWWNGEVVAHERRTERIAVMSVRAHRALPYKAGQYVSLETARWPRVWRTYSMANAPRPDGVLDFHVRAVDAGWVSGALVRHTRVGDTLRIGAAKGNMVVDHASTRDIVMVAGGTGLAPIKALLEETARGPRERPVSVFFGARRTAELYDLAALRRLAESHPRLTVVPAVSHEPEYPGERGMLPDVLVRYGTWHDCDVYVCGSAGMVRATVSRLLETGVPLTRMRYDDFGDM